MREKRVVMMWEKGYGKRNSAMDCLRVLATVLIVFHHYQQFTGVRFAYINFWDGRFYFGWLVEFFFVMSGYFTYKYIFKISGG